MDSTAGTFAINFWFADLASRFEVQPAAAITALRAASQSVGARSLSAYMKVMVAAASEYLTVDPVAVRSLAELTSASSDNRSLCNALLHAAMSNDRIDLELWTSESSASLPYRSQNRLAQCSRLGALLLGIAPQLAASALAALAETLRPSEQGELECMRILYRLDSLVLVHLNTQTIQASSEGRVDALSYVLSSMQLAPRLAESLFVEWTQRRETLTAEITRAALLQVLGMSAI